jgi:hypothetical protein
MIFRNSRERAIDLLIRFEVKVARYIITNPNYGQKCDSIIDENFFPLIVKVYCLECFDFILEKIVAVLNEI